MVEPMSFDTIGNLGNSLTTKARLQEEVRLVELAQSTRVRYTDMGVTNEVPFSSRCTTISMANKSPTGSLPPAVPLAITPTSRPWTHTSDDSYFYQLSLVLATATVSFSATLGGWLHWRGTRAAAPAAASRLLSCCQNPNVIYLQGNKAS